MSNEDLVYRLRKRAEIRRNISTRKSVQEGKPDRLANLLEEAADRIEEEMLAYELLKNEYKITADELKELQSGFSWRV